MCQTLQTFRAIYPLTLIDWLLKTTKEASEEIPAAGKKLGILYDIGCNIKKGIEKVCSLSFPLYFIFVCKVYQVP